MTAKAPTEARGAGTTGRRRSGESTFKRKALALAAFLILAASALNALFGDRGFLSLGERRAEYQALVQEIAALERDNRELAETIRSYRTDPLVIEKRAREVLGMAKQGEIAVVIRPSTAR